MSVYLSGSVCDCGRPASLLLLVCVLLDAAGGGSALPDGCAGVSHHIKTSVHVCSGIRSPSHHRHYLCHRLSTGIRHWSTVSFWIHCCFKGNMKEKEGWISLLCVCVCVFVTMWLIYHPNMSVPAVGSLLIVILSWVFSYPSASSSSSTVLSSSSLCGNWLKNSPVLIQTSPNSNRSGVCVCTIIVFMSQSLILFYLSVFDELYFL